MELTNWTYLLPHVEFAYNASRALGIEYTPFGANFGFSPEEPIDLLFSMRPSNPVSQDASERLKLLQEVHAMVRAGYNCIRTKCKLVQNRREPHSLSKETRCQLLQQTSSYVGYQIGNYKTDNLDLLQWRSRLKLRATVRLHHVFHVNYL
jgi:hypothetical protein